MIYVQPKITFISPHAAPKPFVAHPMLQCFKQEQSVPRILQNRVKLVVWNLHKGEDAGWEQALSHYAKNKDFILLQEASHIIETQTHLPQDFPSRLYVSSFAYRGKESGVAMLSRYIPQIYCVGTGKEPWIRIPKVGMAMLFPLQDGSSLLMINIHLVNFELNTTYYKQQINQMFDLIKHHTGPVIFGGDLNAWSKARYQFLKTLAQKYQLQEVHFNPDYRLRFMRKPLDFVFIRGLQVISATTDKTDSSDHNPLLLDLEFLPQE
ncbi:hypothetical protein A6A19_05195 [Actinobacillus delphinicola]|uniref:Uncharacterized protein conserved in bacteria n=2 Tax=Actinobacillus delphinicola TaxID=51161 RepID=A0A448TTW9_9PAST|nr:hypothetical protein [Actinobacillus delphinicola]VEJ09442.1 Uncharacterized protein conserved in bacteria [Actinobacillus delphinicola]